MPNPVATLALQFADNILNHESPPDVVYSLPSILTDPSGVVLVLPVINPVYQGAVSVATFKCVLKFRSPTGQRWSETYFQSGGASAEAVANMFLGAEFRNLRLAFLAAPHYIYAVEVSDVKYNRLAAKRKIEKTGTGINLGSGNLAAPDVAGTYALLQWRGLLGGTRRTQVRGLGDAWILENPAVPGLMTIQVGIETLMQAWALALTQKGFGWLPRVKVDKAAPVTMFNKITGISGAVSGQATVTCQRDILLPAGGSLTIGRADKKLLPGINGRWFPLSSSANTFLIDYQCANDQNFVGGNLGFARVYQDADFNAYAGVEVIAVGSRKTTNSFTPSRSGKSARGVRHLV